MKRMFGIIGLALVAGFGLSVAFAQVNPPPQVQSLGQTDLTNVLPGGAATAQTQYATVGAVAGVVQYSQQTPVTAFSITVPAHTSYLYLTPAGTLATGTITMELTPADGQNFCVASSQTQTAVTISANTGQTIGGLAMTAGMIANNRYCFFFNKSTAVWYRYLASPS